VCDSKYQEARPHSILAGEIAAKLEQGRARIIVNMPPRHGKSRLFAVETPLWVMVRRPGTESVVASYALDLALRHSREARARLQSEFLRGATTAQLMPDHGQADYWALTNGSSFKAVGVGGSLTGHGADLLILDDLHKDAAESKSPALRQRVWDWLQTVAMTRLSPGASVILIGTRWHQDDVTGRLLGQECGHWDHTNLPALAGENDPLDRSPGEALWPERFPVESLNEIRGTLSNYYWCALYEGHPVPDTGRHVNIERFRVVASSEVPERLRRVRFWDLAVTERTSSDFTVGAHCGCDAEGNLWILDITRGNWEWTRSREIICQRAQIDRCQVGIESVGTQKGLVQNLREVFPAEFLLSEHQPEKDKVTRALPWFSQVNSGHGFLVDGPWNAAFLEECQGFPLGAHDDQIDAVSGAAFVLFGIPAGSPIVIENTRVARAIAQRRERSVTL
jgi:predicted phage terminase large subunit-like protein